MRATVLLLILLTSYPSWSIEINGFDTNSDTITENAIIRIGPVDFPVQSLNSMETRPVIDTVWPEDDFVMGIEINGEARAYPLAIMMWHQIVNDELGGVPILVTFCRTCGTGLVYERRVDDQTLTFGMSGLIHQDDVLLYDKETKSLWSRFFDEAISGSLQGQLLFDLPYKIKPLGEWEQLHPHSTIVTSDTGFDIDYSKTPSGTSTAGENIFPALPSELRYHVDMPVLGVSQNGFAKAYPAGEVLVNGGKITDRFGGTTLVIEYSATQQLFSYDIGVQLKVEQTNWANWTSAHPKTNVFSASTKRAAHRHSPPGSK